MANTITIAQTNSIKGLLILLVIIGHIGELMPLSYLFLLYSFHVTSFLFLPFLFNHDSLNFNNIKKVLRRYYVPYTLFFIFAFMVYTVMIESHFTLFSLLENYLLGTSSRLKESIGFSLYWFFPTLIVLLLLIMIHNTLAKREKRLFVGVLWFAHIGLSLVDKEIWQVSPFYAFAALYLFSIGIAIKWIYENLAWDAIPTWVYVGVLALLLVLSYGSGFNLAKAIMPSIAEEPWYFILHDVIMIVGFFTVLKIGKRLPYLETLGVYSIAIYTIHPFVIQLFNKLTPVDSMMLAVLKFLFVASVAYVLARFLHKTPLYRFIYPR